MSESKFVVEYWKVSKSQELNEAEKNDLLGFLLKNNFKIKVFEV